MPRLTLAERRAERQQVLEEVEAFMKGNPRANRAQLETGLRKRWEARGLDPETIERWLKILATIISLILKVAV
jgi:antibiotic biosynthesis monooxygenase (ABM) superfamily enzyme